MLLTILDDQAFIMHGHSVKGIEQVVRCYENANETSRVLDVEEAKHNLMSTRIRTRTRRQGFLTLKRQNPIWCQPESESEQDAKGS